MANEGKVLTWIEFCHKQSGRLSLDPLGRVGKKPTRRQNLAIPPPRSCFAILVLPEPQRGVGKWVNVEEGGEATTYAFRSAPAQNTRPAPVTMTTLYCRDEAVSIGFKAPSRSRTCSPQTRLLLEPIQHLLQVVLHLWRHRIQLLWPIERQQQDMLRRKRNEELFRGVWGLNGCHDAVRIE